MVDFLTRIRKRTDELLEMLGHDEEPLGVYYSDEKPEGPGPKPGPSLSVEAENRGELDMRAVMSGFSCVMGRVLLARKKKIATWLAADAYGCAGAAFYAGFYKPQLNFITHFVSTGISGVVEGERFMPSPEACRTFFAKIDPRPAPKSYCVIKPLSLFQDEELPETVAFFARGELLCGLAALATFATGESETNVAPFGAGCTQLIAWPLHYRDRGLDRAVIGGTDVACRGLYNLDELSFAVPLPLYQRMLEAAPKSFLITEDWAKVKKRIVQSREKN